MLKSTQEGFLPGKTALLTSCSKAELSAHHHGIWCIPEVVTHRAPCVVEAVLHSALPGIATVHQPDITSGAS